MCNEYREKATNYQEIAEQTIELNKELQQRITMLEATIRRERQERTLEQQEMTLEQPPQAPANMMKHKLDKPEYTKEPNEKRDRNEPRIGSTWSEIAMQVDTEEKPGPSNEKYRQRTDSTSTAESSKKRKKSHKNKLRIAIIGDSNMDRMMPYLQQDETKDWIPIRKTKTADGLMDIVDDEDTIQTLFKCDQILIMIGTNDIKKGKKAEDVDRKLQNAAKEIIMRTLTYTRIVTIPPILIDNETTREQVKLNRIIRSNGKRPIHTRCFDNVDIRRYISHDKYHLTDRGAELLAEEIKIASITEQNHTREDRAIMKVHPRVIPHVIGKGGRTISELRTAHRAKINTTRDEIYMKGEYIEDLWKEIDAIADSVLNYKYDTNRSPTASDRSDTE